MFLILKLAINTQLIELIIRKRVFFILHLNNFPSCSFIGNIANYIHCTNIVDNIFYNSIKLDPFWISGPRTRISDKIYNKDREV